MTSLRTSPGSPARTSRARTRTGRRAASPRTPGTEIDPVGGSCGCLPDRGVEPPSVKPERLRRMRGRHHSPGLPSCLGRLPCPYERAHERGAIASTSIPEASGHFGPLPAPHGVMLSTRLHPAPCWSRFVELLIAVFPMMLVGQPIDRPTALPSAVLLTTVLPPPTSSPLPPFPVAVLPMTVPPTAMP